LSRTPTHFYSEVAMLARPAFLTAFLIITPLLSAAAPFAEAQSDLCEIDPSEATFTIDIRVGSDGPKRLIQRLKRQAITLIGAVIDEEADSTSTHLLASQEVEEEISRGCKHLWQRKGASDAELKYAAWDVNTGMLLSTVVMYFIILATATTLYKAGKTDIQSARDAAEAQRPLAGNAARVLLALGLIGSGFLVVKILTGGYAYSIAEAFDWKLGLDKRPGRAKGFYGIIAGCTLIGALVNFAGINPIKALFWTAVINGMLAPPLLVIIMLASNKKDILGDRRNGVLLNVLGWLTALVMAAAAIGLMLTWNH
jgi:Mn2+/Fe2+ NRAMP family transporter